MDGEYLPQRQVVRTALRVWLTEHGYLKKRGHAQTTMTRT